MASGDQLGRTDEHSAGGTLERTNDPARPTSPVDVEEDDPTMSKYSQSLLNTRKMDPVLILDN